MSISYKHRCFILSNGRLFKTLIDRIKDALIVVNLEERKEKFKNIYTKYYTNHIDHLDDFKNFLSTIFQNSQINLGDMQKILNNPTHITNCINPFKNPGNMQLTNIDFPSIVIPSTRRPPTGRPSSAPPRRSGGNIKTIKVVKQY